MSPLTKAGLAALGVLLAVACGDAGTEPAGSPDGFRAVSVGSEHTCGLSTSNEVFCWGSNAGSRLGASVDADADLPVRVLTDPFEVGEVVAGADFGCMILGDGSAACWGQSEVMPRALEGADGLESLVAGDFPCARRSDGQLACWPSIDASPVVIAGAADLHGESVGGFACALDADGQPACWTATSPTPVPVASPVALASVTVGDRHACGVDAAGGAWCWGDNDSGQLGDNTFTARSTPTAVFTVSPKQWTALSAGGTHTCGLESSGEVTCWGAGGSGQLGLGGASPPGVPVPFVGSPVDSPLRWVTVEAGADHTCARAADDRVACWGESALGQTGVGTRQPVLAPTEVTP